MFSRTKAFTLIELIMYVGIFAVVAGMLAGIFTMTVKTGVNEAKGVEVGQELETVMRTVEQIVQRASLIEKTYEGTNEGVPCTQYCSVKIRVEDETRDPIIIRSDNAGVYIKEGAGAEVSLTSAHIRVDQFTLTKHDILGGHATLEIGATFTYDAANPTLAITKSRQSVIGRVSAATFDSDLLPDVTDSRNIGQSSPLLRWQNLFLSGLLGLGTYNVDPGGGVEGTLYYNTVDKKVKVYDGSSWGPMGDERNFSVPSVGGVAQWSRIGTFTANQSGQTVRIVAYIHNGYNAVNSQDSVYYINFKTSNGASVDANGFAGNGSWYAFGFNSAIPSGNIKWVANAPGTAATSYDLYILLPAHSNNSHYAVSISSSASWSNVGVTGQSDPGAASSTVLVPTPELNIPYGNVGIGTTSPGQKLDILNGNMIIGSTTDLGGNNFGTIKFRSPGGGTTDIRSSVDGLWGSTGNRYGLAIDLQDDNTSGFSVVRQNVGPVFGVRATGEVYVGNSIKFGADSSIMSKAPRVVHTEDGRGGCPPAAAANTDLLVQSITLSRTSAVYINASMIRNYSGRADMQLMIDGVEEDRTLDYTPSQQWFDDNVHWAGTLAAGAHTISLRGSVANAWGCGAQWGSIDTLIFE